LVRRILSNVYQKALESTKGAGTAGSEALE
jgi:hypothetical protein